MNVALLKDFECLIEEQKILAQSPQGKEFADFERWQKEFPEFNESLKKWARESLNFLDRANVRELSHRSISEGNLTEAFLIVMIWGYSGDARGPARTRLIIEQPNFLESLKLALEFLARHMNLWLFPDQSIFPPLLVPNYFTSLLPQMKKSIH